MREQWASVLFSLMAFPRPSQSTGKNPSQDQGPGGPRPEDRRGLCS